MTAVVRERRPAVGIGRCAAIGALRRLADARLHDHPAAEWRMAPRQTRYKTACGRLRAFYSPFTCPYCKTVIVVVNEKDDPDDHLDPCRAKARGEHAAMKLEALLAEDVEDEGLDAIQLDQEVAEDWLPFDTRGPLAHLDELDAEDLS